MKSELYHQQLMQLQNCILELEKGDIPFSEILRKYEEGLKLKTQCQETLNHLQESALSPHHSVQYLKDRSPEVSNSPIEASMNIDEIFKNLEQLNQLISHENALEHNIEHYHQAQQLWQMGENVLNQYASELIELEPMALLSLETDDQTLGDD